MFDNEILKQRLSDFAGEFESHITVVCDQNRFSIFRERCEELDAKALIIELIAGIKPVQPMLCKRHSAGTLDTLRDISNMVGVLSEEFEVERVKIEAALKNDGIPDNEISASKLPADCYFEHHVKLRLPPDFDEAAFRKRIANYSGHLSRNPLSKEGGALLRFVTQRIYNSTRQDAESKLSDLLMFLEETDQDVLQVIREFNIYDSNIDRDAGWIV